MRETLAALHGPPPEKYGISESSVKNCFPLPVIFCGLSTGSLAFLISAAALESPDAALTASASFFIPRLSKISGASKSRLLPLYAISESEFWKEKHLYSAIPIAAQFELS
ncbi:hypothetical protein R80B4_02341 [Fibrobacteres bacterium R8-0-B4]